MGYFETIMDETTRDPARAPFLSVTDLTQAAVFAALIAALGLPGTINLSSGVPITLQSLGVMLAGCVLGPKKGTLAVAIFAVLALVGLPILAGGRNGWTSLTSVTGGFFVGFLPAAFIIGLLTALMMPKYRWWLGIVFNVIGGLLVIYTCGIAGMMIKGMTFDAALSANTSFIAGDVGKAVVASLVAAQVHRGWPGLITPLGPAGFLRRA